MQYREIIAEYSKIHTKHIYTACVQIVDLLNVELLVNILIIGLQSVKSVLQKQIS